MKADAVLTERVARDLRAAIVAQEIAPGAAVTEALVAERFAVARPTARLTIDRLVADGILRRLPHAAARVPVLDADDIGDLYDNRALIEAHGLSRLAGTSTVPQAAHDAQAALESSDAAHAAALDIAFHRALLAGQPSPRLAALHESLMGEVELCIGQVFAADLIDLAQVSADHRAMLAAVLAGDRATASRVAAEHVLKSRDALLAHYRAAHAA